MAGIVVRSWSHSWAVRDRCTNHTCECAGNIRWTHGHIRTFESSVHRYHLLALPVKRAAHTHAQPDDRSYGATSCSAACRQLVWHGWSQHLINRIAWGMERRNRTCYNQCRSPIGSDHSPSLRDALDMSKPQPWIACPFISTWEHARRALLTIDTANLMHHSHNEQW